jgi:hypothetical protein
MGLRKLLTEFEIEACELDYPQPARGEILLAPFNGNLCAPYHGFIERFERYAGRFKQLCLLPGSADLAYAPVRDFFRRLSPKAMVFCRERYSYEQLRNSLKARQAIWLDHDLAFAANVAPWQRQGRGSLMAFRSDAESLGGSMPAGNFDFPAFSWDWMADLLLDVVASFQTIHTDHAHVAIAAARLGKETHVYATSYHKVRGIYEFSLRENPRVSFHQGRPETPPIDGAADPRFEIWRERARKRLADQRLEGFS